MMDAREIRDLLDEAGVTLSPYKMNLLVDKLRGVGNYNRNAALADITAVKNPQPFDIESAILRNTEQKRYCGYCHDGWIPILETKAWAQMERPVFVNTILVPQAMTPCPNCSTRKGDALTVLESQEPDAQGWSFALLFNFIRYTLGRTDITPDQFTPSQYWPSLVWEPPLSFAQMELMEWISAPSSVPMPRLPKNHRMAAVVRNVQLRIK
jgi:hypothetical protein